MKLKFCTIAVICLHFTCITKSASGELAVGGQYELAISLETGFYDYQGELPEVTGFFDATLRFEVVDLVADADGIHFYQQINFLEGESSMRVDYGNSSTTISTALSSSSSSFEGYYSDQFSDELSIELDQTMAFFVSAFTEGGPWEINGGFIDLVHPELGFLGSDWSVWHSASVSLTPVPAPASFPLLLAAIAGRRSRKLVEVKGISSKTLNAL